MMQELLYLFALQRPIIYIMLTNARIKALGTTFLVYYIIFCSTSLTRSFFESILSL
jgi:hypothetical protein